MMPKIRNEKERNILDLTNCPWFRKGESSTDIFECYNDEYKDFCCNTINCKYKKFIREKLYLQKRNAAIRNCAYELKNAIKNDSCSFEDLLADVEQLANTLEEILNENSNV